MLRDIIQKAADLKAERTSTAGVRRSAKPKAAKSSGTAAKTAKAKPAAVRSRKRR